jgi:restriction system protein
VMLFLLSGVVALLVQHYVAIFLVLGFAIAALVWLLAERRRASQRRESEVQSRIDVVIGDHLDTLIRRRTQVVYRDDYGREITKKWETELKEFVHFHLLPALSADSRATITAQPSSLVNVVEAKVLEALAQRPAMSEFSQSMSPRDFEVFCANQLRAMGWDATVTQASGDQGVDVIATKDKIRMVVQCKLYSRPIGNKAVQEVSAARLHQSAQYAVVVSNQTYTTSARNLAKTNRVVLLHFSELSAQDFMSKLMGSV